MTAAAGADAIAEPQLRALYLYWSGKRRGETYPAREAILPEEIRTLLPFVVLMDVLEGGRYLRFRLVGTDAAAGIDPTGQLMHEAVPEGIYRDHITALYRRGAAGPGALYSQSRYRYAEIEGPRSISRLFMPLAGDGATIDMLLVGQKADRDPRIGKSAWQANPPTISEELELRLP